MTSFLCSANVQPGQGNHHPIHTLTVLAWIWPRLCCVVLCFACIVIPFCIYFIHLPLALGKCEVVAVQHFKVTPILSESKVASKYSLVTLESFENISETLLIHFEIFFKWLLCFEMALLVTNCQSVWRHNVFWSSPGVKIKYNRLTITGNTFPWIPLKRFYLLLVYDTNHIYSYCFRRK